jgi:threonine dehydrogenase-like Zn-dependent dehydrogenase
MRAAQYFGEKDVRVADAPRPEIEEPTDAILRVTTSAICGTDLHIYHDKTPGAEPGMILGHEFVGVVDEVGSAVREIEPGTRAVSAMYTACGRCVSCLSGNHRGCPAFLMFGMGPMAGDLPGGQAELVRVPMAEMTLAPVPDGMADEEALFVSDILSTAYSGLKAGAIRPGDSVAVVGAGPLGQLVVACAPLLGAAKVFAIDLVEERLKQAAELGAIAIDAREGDPLDAVFDHTNNQGADLVIEAVGAQPSLATAFTLPRVEGRIVLLGVLLEEEFPVTAGEAFVRGLSVSAVIGNPFAYRPELMRLIEAGRLSPARIVSHSMPLDEAAEAYRMFDAKEATKVVLKP